MLSEGDAPPPLGGRRPLVADGDDVGLDAGGRGDGRLERVLGQGRVRPLQGHARHLAGLRGPSEGRLEVAGGLSGVGGVREGGGGDLFDSEGAQDGDQTTREQGRERQRRTRGQVEPRAFDV